MRLNNVRADQLLDQLAQMGIELSPQSQQAYFEFWAAMGYPRSTTGIQKDAIVLRELNKWAKSTGQDIKFVEVNMTDYANKREQHPIVKVDAVAPVQEKITKSMSMGDVIKDFYASDAPQFQGKSKAKRRQMAIAAKLAVDNESKKLAHLAQLAERAFESLYVHNKENALDSEVLVPGYGRMSFKGLQQKVGDKFAELGKMLKDGDASTVKKVQYLIKNDPMLAMLNSLETAFDELSAKRKRGGRGSRGIGSEFSEMKIAEFKAQRYNESAEERPYVCVHAKKGKHECTATSSYGAAKKAAKHWGLKSTAGIDAYLADVKHVAESDDELEYNGKLHPSIDHTIEHDDPSFCYDCKLVSTTHGEIDTENDEADVVCPRCGSQAYVDASPEEIDKYASPEAWMSEADHDNKGFTDKQIKMAFGILNDPRYHQGNYSGAVNAIEKIAKGLSKHPSVANALMRANESTVKEEWDKPIDKAQFQANEAENMHTENAVALARRFGTPEEHQKMLDIYEAHMDRGWIEEDELEYRDSIIKKYYPMLEAGAYDINGAILNPQGHDTCVCKHCGDKLHEPTTDCPYDSHDPNGSNWIIIRAEESEQDVYNSLKEAWSQEYKDSIDCNNPKGFSQKAHCAGRKKKNKG